MALFPSGNWNQRKTKGQQPKGKIVSALFRTFFAVFHTFYTSSEFFRIFPPGLFLELRCFATVVVQRDKKTIKRKDHPILQVRCCRFVLLRWKTPDHVHNADNKMPFVFCFRYLRFTSKSFVLKRTCLPSVCLKTFSLPSKGSVCSAFKPPKSGVYFSFTAYTLIEIFVGHICFML